MGVLRYPNVAGTFYPADPRALASQVRAYLRSAPDQGPRSRAEAESRTGQAAGSGTGSRARADALGQSLPGSWPKALIVPHVTKFYTGSVGHGVDEPMHTVTANSFKKRPGGATPQKPVGTVMFARAIKGEPEEECHAFRKDFGDTLSRAEVRHQAVLVALELLLP